MVILLKTVCFALWMLLMLALIVGSRRSTASFNLEVYLKEDEKNKMTIK